MNFKQTLILLVASSLSMALVAGDSVLRRQEVTNLHLLNFMARSNSLMRSDPSRSMECFNYYIPIINEIATTYETNYNVCLQNGVDARADAEVATLEQRNNLASQASDSCELLSQCSVIESAIGVFECYIKGGSENAKTMYAINADASDGLTELREALHLVENEEYKCCNATKRAYENDSAKAYEGFNNCMAGISEVPTDAPETEAPETEAPETEAPETEAPETEAPETEAPETEAPETEAPETEAPETEAPETEAPETEAPETEAPETEAPETEAPETEAPETEAPETEAPETQEKLPEEDLSDLRKRFIARHHKIGY